MNKAAQFYSGLNEAITNKIDSVAPFRAVVHAIVDGKVQIQMIGTDAPLDAPIARVEGFDLKAGDEVLVGRTSSGSLIVFGRLQRSAGTEKSLSENLIIRDTNQNALAVRDSNNLEVFKVDTEGSFKVINILNDTALEAWGSDSQNKWYVGATGDAYFSNGVTATRYNSPYIYAHDQDNANVSSTTSTSQFYEALTATINLPAGTWDVTVDSACEFRHSANGNVRFLTEISGNQSLSFAPQFYSDAWGTGRMTLTFTGVSSGNQLVKFMYRSSTAGTSYAKNPKILIIATRTS